MITRARWGEWLRKSTASLVVVLGVAWWGRSGPLPRAAAQATSFEVVGSPGEAGGLLSPFVFDGLPLTLETLELRSCDAASWTPEGHLSLWSPQSLLLDLERDSREVTAVWTVEEDASLGKAPTDAAPELSVGSVTYHAARLICRDDGRGELSHVRTVAPTDESGFEQLLSGSKAERVGPVPLLADSVQLLVFRNLGWILTLDEPSGPYSAIDRLQETMEAGGWRARETPSREPPQPAGTAGLLDGRVLVRDGEFCLLNRVQVEGSRELLFAACRERS